MLPETVWLTKPLPPTSPSTTGPSTATETTLVAVPPCPSEAWTVKLSVPV